MRRMWIIAGLFLVATGSMAAYQRASNWKVFHYPGNQLMVNLGEPDALIRTASLAQLPKDLLKAPIARDVLTEDLVFYYEQHEDQLGLKGAIKRIAYEHELTWSDHLFAAVMDEPAEMALWRDGKGALRHFAIVMQRNALAKVMQQAAQVALKDAQLKFAAEIEHGAGKAQVLALEINPRRTLLLVTEGDHMIVLSDPGLLFNKNNKIVPEARAAIVNWLTQQGTLTRYFALSKEPDHPLPAHTLVVSASALSLGYGSFFPGFKGLRFEFNESWSTHVWIDPKGMPRSVLGDAALWRAVPANPSACVVLPVDWQAPQDILNQADKKSPRPSARLLAGMEGSALACWYKDSNLYSPLFISRQTKNAADRKTALQALAEWAFSQSGEVGQPATTSSALTTSNKKRPSKKLVSFEKHDSIIWRSEEATTSAAIAATNTFVLFSPDSTLVDLALDTLARKNPSVADQMPVSNATLALFTPRPLAAMAEHEALAALSGPGDANLLAAAQMHLPPRMKALGAYPAYRLDMKTNPQSGWQPVQWRTAEERN